MSQHNMNYEPKRFNKNQWRVKGQRGLPQVEVEYLEGHTATPEEAFGLPLMQVEELSPMQAIATRKAPPVLHTIVETSTQLPRPEACSVGDFAAEIDYDAYTMFNLR